MKNFYQKTPKIGFVGACLRYIEDPNQSIITRVFLAISPLILLYIISPFDILPELVLGPLGLADDTVLAMSLFLLIRLAVSLYSEKRYVKPKKQSKHNNAIDV